MLGAGLATGGWTPAVQQRDAIVAGAGASPITQADRRGDHLQAALLDFGSNLGLGAIPTTVMGISVIGPFPVAAYRGWVGGIVSIDSSHRSRLLTARGGVYYLVTIVLQLVGYVLTMAAGVHVGWTAWTGRNDATVRSVLGVRIPGWALRDAAWLYAVAIPAFLVGSLWEFLA